MPNMSPNKVKMPEQDPNVRNKNFEEVSLGYTKEQAMEEATRCLNCKKPFCMDGCPVGVPIPEFIHHVAEGEFEEAYQTITRENALPAICGRVCPQENQCEGKCVRGIKTESVGIGRLERFVADYHREHGKPAELKIEKNGKKVAVIGSGPAGITCAGELAKKGYDVTVFEQEYLAQMYMELYLDKINGFISIDSAPLQKSYMIGIKYLNFMVRKSKAHSIRSSWSFIKNRNASS